MKEGLSLEKNQTSIPAQAVPLLLDWYRQSARSLPWRMNTDPYRVWISEVMLQQTRVEAVIPYYLRFLERLPTVEALATVSDDELHKLWEGLGYYRRAANLKRAAQQIVQHWGGSLPRSYEGLRQLSGIGDYTAGAIASICYGLPTPAVDGNVLRVVARLTADDDDILLAATKSRYREALAAVYPAGRCGDFTQSLMELGATVCTPTSPRCDSCPIAAHCLAFAEGVQRSLPVRAEKRPRRVEQRTLLLLHCGDCIALARRPADGLLGGLWEFPGLAGQLSPDELACWLTQAAIPYRAITAAGTAKHLFTHIEWQMTAYHIDCTTAVDDYTWVTPAVLAQDYALPSAFRAFARLL